MQRDADGDAGCSCMGNSCLEKALVGVEINFSTVFLNDVNISAWIREFVGETQ